MLFFPQPVRVGLPMPDNQHSPPRDYGYGPGWWTDWFFILLIVALVVLSGLVTSIARGGEKETGEASAALALAQAKRERDAKAVAASACFTDLATAQKECDRTGKPIVVWVGIQCKDYPTLRKPLDAAVHVHVRKFAGSDEPCVVIKGGDGINYWIRPENIQSTTAEKIKQAWARPYVAPKRLDVGIAEEISYVPPVWYATQPVAQSGRGFGRRAAGGC